MANSCKDYLIFLRAFARSGIGLDECHTVGVVVKITSDRAINKAMRIARIVEVHYLLSY